MNARLPLLLAGLTAFVALGLLGAFAPAASAAPVGPASTAACTVHVALYVPAVVNVGAPFPVVTAVQLGGHAAACHATVYLYGYFGFQVPAPNAPGFTAVALHPGTYQVGVLVHGSFGVAFAVTTFTAR